MSGGVFVQMGSCLESVLSGGGYVMDSRLLLIFEANLYLLVSHIPSLVQLMKSI